MLEEQARVARQREQSERQFQVGARVADAFRHYLEQATLEHEDVSLEDFGLWLASGGR
jgi:dsDNA-binding SOS-regulon protein